MLKKTVTYTDFNGVERTEDYLFHFNKAEIAEMELSENGGYSELLKKIVASKDTPSIIRYFKKLVLDAYGVKSEDGRSFRKSKELRDAFEQSEPYSIIFMELATDDKAAAAFVNGVFPADMTEKVQSIAPAARKKSN